MKEGKGSLGTGVALTSLLVLAVAPPGCGSSKSQALRRAFAVASKELHPDRYFAKNLGSFKPRLAAIFARLSEAMQEIEDEQKGKR